MTSAKFASMALRRYEPFGVSSPWAASKSRSSSAKFTTRSYGASPAFADATICAK
jgi:hypothetical protein